MMEASARDSLDTSSGGRIEQHDAAGIARQQARRDCGHTRAREQFGGALVGPPAGKMDSEPTSVGQQQRFDVEL